MLNLLFALLMLIVFIPMGIIAVKASWPFIKVILVLLFLPVILILCFIEGLLVICWPLLLITLAIFLICRLSKRNEDIQEE